MDNTEEIRIEEIVRFLETERELYGPFSVPQSSSSATETPGQTVTNPRKEEFEQPSTDRLTTEAGNVLAQCTTLEELQQYCEQADELRTDLNGTNLVFGVGNPEADLMLIGEAPGAEEDRRGEPFVGAAGKLLDKILEAIRFKRDDVYIANILKHRPPDNRTPTPDERNRSLPYLMKQIDLVCPKLILCLGKVAGTTLLNKEKPLRDLRGRFYPFRGAELTVTYHPAALLRHRKWKRPVWEDVQKVRKRYDELGCKP